MSRRAAARGHDPVIGRIVARLLLAAALTLTVVTTAVAAWPRPGLSRPGPAATQTGSARTQARTAPTRPGTGPTQVRTVTTGACRPTPSVYDALQANAWYLPTADGQARLYVTSMGCGPTVVVLHGGPGNDFQYLVDALSPLRGHYRFILFDQRGSLLSPVKPDDVKTISQAALVRDLETLRRALGERRLVLFGHSWGTVLAQAYYRAHPDRVAALVLAGAAPPRADSAHTFMDYIRAARPRMKALRARPAVAMALAAAGIPTGARSGAGGSAGPLSPQLASARARIELAGMNIFHVDRWRRMYGGGVYYNPAVDDAVAVTLPETYDIAPALAAHPVPITVIQGDHDYVDPGASQWMPLARTHANVRIDVLHDAGHYAWIDAPAAFTHALTTALAR